MPTKGLAVVLAENIYENLELHYPLLRLIEAGYDTKVVAPEKGATYGSKEGYPVKADLTFTEVDVKAIKILIVPGGFAPDKLRRYPPPAMRLSPRRRSTARSSASSATAAGCRSARKSSKASVSPACPRSATTSKMPAPPGSTNAAWSTAAWLPPRLPRICPR